MVNFLKMICPAQQQQQHSASPASTSNLPKLSHNNFFKWANPGLFFRLFSSFQTNTTILTTNKCEKCPSGIWHRDSNSQPSDYKSPPLTTRTGLCLWPFISKSKLTIGLIAEGVTWILTYILCNMLLIHITCYIKFHRKFTSLPYLPIYGTSGSRMDVG